MQTLWQQWTQSIASHISDALGETVQANEIVVPPDNKLGDFAFACFKYAKAKGTNPAELAKQVVAKLSETKIEGMTFNAAGPYVNVALKSEQLVSEVVKEVTQQREKFGKRESLEEKPILIEYANPNTHKEIHLGHLRNFLTGRAFVSVLRAAGKNVIPVSYVNDQGANVAKTLWFMLRKADVDLQALTLDRAEKFIAELPSEQKTGKYLGEMYTQAVKKLEEPESLVFDHGRRGNGDVFATQALEQQKVSYVQSQLEAHQPGYERLWQATRDWCLQELEIIFKELDIDIEKMYLESDFIDRAQEVVDELVKKGIAKESQGALIVDLEEEKLGVMLVRKSDGNLLYASKDLALGEQKIKDFPEVIEFYTVVDVRQGPYFKQLESVFSKLEHKQSFKALCYELLKLPEGAMSSRKGNIVTYQDMMSDVFDYALVQVAARHADWPQQKIEEVAKQLALGGVTFGVLKQDPEKIFIFDREQALAFEGATGPYCQYAVTRLNSILRKAEDTQHATRNTQHVEDHQIVEMVQKQLALTAAQLPEKVALAAKELRPSIVAQWCLDMAQAVSAFYRDVPVLSAAAEVKERRIELVKAAKIALSNGLATLGIPTPEEM